LGLEHHQSEFGDWFKRKGTNDGIFQGQGVSVNLSSIEGYVFRFYLGSLEVNYSVRAVVKSDDRVQSPFYRAGRGMSGNCEWSRLNPTAARIENSAREGGQYIRRPLAREVDFHLPIDDGEDFRHWAAWSAEATDDLEVKAALALLPKKGKV